MIHVYAASNASTLRQELSRFARTATVEAEYGNDVVLGSVITRAHHAPEYAHNPSPCTFRNDLVGQNDDLKLEAIGLSHIDLDSVGGTLALLGVKPGGDSFWRLAGQVDVCGPHRLLECQKTAEATDADVRALRAYWAWSRSPAGRVELPKDGSVKLVDSAIATHGAALACIFEGERILLEAGDKFAADEEAINADSFVEMVDGGVIIRVGPAFCNHLYSAPGGGATGRAVVAFNTRYGSITLSFADAPPTGVTARDITQHLWGMEAGGHAGIAGSPRGKRMTFNDLRQAAVAMSAVLVSAAPANAD